MMSVFRSLAIILGMGIPLLAHADYSYFTVSAPSGARIRSTPSLQNDGSVVSALPDGAMIRMSSDEQPFYQRGLGHWLQIEYCDSNWQNCKKGFINQKIVKQADAPDTTPTVPLPKPRPDTTPTVPLPKPRPDTAGPDRSKVNKCIINYSDKSKDGVLVKKAFEQLAHVNPGALPRSTFNSKRGFQFMLTANPTIRFVLTGAPTSEIIKFATALFGNQPDQKTIDGFKTTLQQGSVAFDAKLCVRKGKASMELVGTSGPIGTLALTPQGSGFQTNGRVTLPITSNPNVEVKDVFTAR